MKNDWHKHVYKRKTKNDMPGDWNKIRRTVFSRDKYRCQRCEKHIAYARLTCHHIIPRNEGGTNDITNLVSLCEHCHDDVEILGLRILSSIMYDDNAEVQYRQEKDIGKKEDFERPYWHSFVYGSAKNPNV